MRPFLTVTIAWIVGLAVAVTLGMLLAVLVPGPAATVAGPLVLGLFVGLGQRRALRERARRGFVASTAAGAAIGWLLGTFVAWRLHGCGLDGVAPWANGPIVGAVVGAVQSFAYRGTPRARIVWALGSVVAWTAAIGPWLAPGLSPYVRLAALAVPGIFAAITQLTSRKAFDGDRDRLVEGHVVAELSVRSLTPAAHFAVRE